MAFQSTVCAVAVQTDVSRQTEWELESVELMK